ncbi:short-chain dehydrogenase/reductase SDR [Penicillium angulare]|uniref:Short-chain dehydrogenase/reductase SDR n=1 Tax=Penicillium angulare TaxID=116970 RepID=A0A9W9EG45_9EURO|nr:short-chain dehydrogenase/reductase SDR [Penicillium angulare]
MTTQQWLITGASSGLGVIMAELALKEGHKVICTARDPTKAKEQHPQIEKLGGTWIQLDVTSKETTKKVEDAIREVNGKIDVVVNNAGYSLLGSIEDMSETEIENQFSTNLYGPVRVLKGALPFMRAQKSGTIVNISSSAGIDGVPTCAMYAGSKFALEGMSESLSKELAPFGIRVLLVEPGSLRTPFWTSFVSPAAGMNKDYAGTPLEDVLKRFGSQESNQPGDPFKTAQRIVEVVTGTGMGVGKESLFRLPLGSDCYRRFQTKIDGMQQNLKDAEEISHSTGYQ